MIHDLVNRGTERALAAGRIEYLVSRRNKPKLQLPVSVRCSRDEISFWSFRTRRKAGTRSIHSSGRVRDSNKYNEGGIDHVGAKCQLSLEALTVS